MKTPSNDRLLRRAGRVEARAVKKMDKAKSTWTKAEAVRKFNKQTEKSDFAGNKIGTSGIDKANQLYKRAARQEKSAKRKMEKASYLKAASGAKSKSQLAKAAGKAVGSMAPVVLLGAAASKKTSKKK